MTDVRRRALLVGALAAAALAAGCSDGGSRRLTENGSARGPGVAEGARLRGTLTRSLQFRDSGGAVRAASSATEPYEARMRRGVATTEGGGSLVAMAAVRSTPGPVSFVDSSGHRHEIIVEAGRDGGPPAAVNATLDGRPLARVDLTWRQTEYGYALARRVVTLYGRGGAEVREDVTLDLPGLAARGAVNRRLADLARRAGTGLLPPRLEASTVMDESCWVEWIYYGFASLAVAVAVDAVIAEPWNLKAWVALGAAVKLWDSALDALVGCMMMT